MILRKFWFGRFIPSVVYDTGRNLWFVLTNFVKCSARQKVSASVKILIKWSINHQHNICWIKNVTTPNYTIVICFFSHYNYLHFDIFIFCLLNVPFEYLVQFLTNISVAILIMYSAIFLLFDFPVFNNINKYSCIP